MGKKSDKIEAAKAKSKALKTPKSDKTPEKTPGKTAAKPAAKPVEIVPEVKAPAPVAPVKVSEKSKPKQKAEVSKPTFEEIQVEAYHIGQKRVADGIAGSPAEDWIAAEKSLLKARGL